MKTTVKEKYKELITYISQMGHKVSFLNATQNELSIQLFNYFMEEIIVVHLFQPLNSTEYNYHRLKISWRTPIESNLGHNTWYYETTDQSVIFKRLLFDIISWKIQNIDKKTVDSSNMLIHEVLRSWSTSNKEDTTKESLNSEPPGLSNNPTIEPMQNKSNKQTILKWTKKVGLFIGYFVISFLYFCLIGYCSYLILGEGKLRSYIGLPLAIIPPIMGVYCLIKNLYKKDKKERTTFIKSWKLSDFASNYSSMQIGKFQPIIGKARHKCIFTKNDGAKLFVKFLPALKEMTATEISEKKAELRIGLTISQDFYLYREGDSINYWEKVTL